MEIKIPIELFKGKESFPLRMLGDIVREIEKFFKMLGEDVQIEADSGEWLITNVKGGSLTGTAFKAGVPEAKAKLYLHNYKQIIEDPIGRKHNNLISRRTRRQLANIGKNLNPGDAINFGVIDEKSKVTWHSLSKETSLEIIETVEKQIIYRGSIQGTIHDIQIESRPYYFNIRELSTQKLIRCEYNGKLYEEIWKTLKKRTGIIYVSGLITANQVDEKIEYIKLESANDIILAPEYKHGDLQKFIGCCPTLLGKKNLQAWINEVRGRG